MAASLYDRLSRNKRHVLLSLRSASKVESRVTTPNCCKVLAVGGKDLKAEVLEHPIYYIFPRLRDFAGGESLLPENAVPVLSGLYAGIDQPHHGSVGDFIGG